MAQPPHPGVVRLKPSIGFHYHPFHASPDIKQVPASEAEPPTFIYFTALPEGIQGKIWELAVAVPRMVEFWGTMFYDRPQSNTPFFSLHPLLHTCRISREIFKSQFQKRLPVNLKSFVHGKNWVPRCEHLGDLHVPDAELQSLNSRDKAEKPQYAFLAGRDHPMNYYHNIQDVDDHVIHYWLNFDGSKDVFFHNGRFPMTTKTLVERLNKYSVKYFACDMREFYSGFVEWRKEQYWKEGGEDAGWDLVRGIQGLRELTLVLVGSDKEYGYGISESGVEFLDFEWDGISEAEKKEMTEWRELTRLKLEEKNWLWSDWEVPKIRFAYARRKEKPYLEKVALYSDNDFTETLPSQLDDWGSAEHCILQRPLSLL